MERSWGAYIKSWTSGAIGPTRDRASREGGGRMERREGVYIKSWTSGAIQKEVGPTRGSTRILFQRISGFLPWSWGSKVMAGATEALVPGAGACLGCVN